VFTIDSSISLYTAPPSVTVVSLEDSSSLRRYIPANHPHDSHATRDMNDEPSASSSFDPIPSEAETAEVPRTDVNTTSANDEVKFHLKKRAEVHNRKASEFLEDILRNLDIVTYCHLAVLYYME
jgi:hypothetical protein